MSLALLVNVVLAVLAVLVIAAAALVVGLLARRRGVWLGVVGLVLLAVSRIVGTVVGMFLPVMMRRFRLPYSALVVVHGLIEAVLTVLAVVFLALGFITVARRANNQDPMRPR